MKYKLIKDLPNVKAGTIWELQDGWATYTSDGNKYNYPSSAVENNPDWFAPYVETTQDGIDMFVGDYGAVLFIKTYHTEKDTITGHTFIGKANPKYVLTFSTKEKAQEYFNSLQEFKAGDTVVANTTGYPILLKVVYVNEGAIMCDNNTMYNAFALTKADNDEILSYYAQQGWVKGAKFNWKDSYSENYQNNVVFYNFEWLGGILYAQNNKEDVYEITNCKLIKESTIGGFGYLKDGEIIIP